MSDKDKDEIKELVDKIRPTDAEVNEDADGEPLEDFAERFRGAKRTMTDAFAEALMPRYPLIGLLTERSQQSYHGPTTRRVDLRRMSNGELRDLRDRIDRELDRRNGGAWP